MSSSGSRHRDATERSRAVVRKVPFSHTQKYYTLAIEDLEQPCRPCRPCREDMNLPKNRYML